MLNSRYFNCALIVILLTAFSILPGFAQDSETQVAAVTDKRTEPVTETTAPAPEEPESKPVSAGSYLRRVGVNITQTRSLSLDQAIRLALGNNNSIKIAGDDVRIAESGLRSLEGNYDGSFSFSPTYTRNNTTGQPGTNDIRVNSLFSKQITKGGGSYQVFFNNSRTENAFAQAQATSGNIGGSSSSALFFTSVGVTYTQPLLRDFRVDQTRRLIKIQRKRIAQSDADFRRQTIDTISQVQQAYWDLVFALRDQQNRVANLNLTKENLRQVEAKIKAGSAAPLERAEVSTELANRESDVLVASQQVSISENVLKQLLYADAIASEWSESLVPTDLPAQNLTSVNLDDAIKDAISNRPELSRLRLEKEVNEVDLDYFKNQTLPRLDLTSTVSLNGIAQSGADSTDSLFLPLISGDPTSSADAFLLQQIRLLNNGNPTDGQIPILEIPPTPGYLTGGYTQSLRNIFRSDAPNYTFGVTYTFPVRNRTAEANLATAEFQKSKLDSQTRTQEQVIIAEVRNAVQAVETSRQRVLTAKRARVNAEIQLDGERKLYDVGRSTTFLLFQRENALTNARNAEIRAETDYNKALADLQRVTSTTLDSNNVKVDSPSTDDDGN